MARGKYVSDKEKEIISILYGDFNISAAKTSELLGRHFKTIHDYKYYKSKSIRSRSVQKKEKIEIYDASKEQAINITDQPWFKDIYQFFTTKAGHEDSPSEFFIIVRNRFWSRYKKQIKSCPKYEGRLKVDIIKDIVDLLGKEYLKNV